MKTSKLIPESLFIIVILILLMATREAAGQQTAKASQAIPDNVSKIFTHSCTPCHSSKGSGIAKSMVNFDSWTKLSADKQTTKAGKISKAVTSGFMPKKSEREKRPEIILTKEQIDVVNKWAETYKSGK